MVAVTENKVSYRKALLIASGPAMLEKMVRPLKDAGMGVNACENFVDAMGLFAKQALVVLPLTEDDQSEAKAFVDWLRRQGKSPPYVLGVGRCEAAQRKGVVARMGLNDLITLPFDETVVQERLASFRRWCQLREEKEASEGGGRAVPREVPQVATMPAELLQSTRVSLFAGASGGENEERPESIYCREAPVGIAMFDRELRYVLANPRWVQQFRLQDKEIIGRSQFDIFPRLHPNWRKIYQRCLDGETRRGRETIDSGQGPLEMRWEVRPWRYLAGPIGGVTIAFEEVWKVAEGSREVPKGADEDPYEIARSFIQRHQRFTARTKLIRRSGHVVLWNAAKIETAVSKAFLSLELDPSPSKAVAEEVTRVVEEIPQDFIHIEKVQDKVQETLMRLGYYKVAEAYILYRARQAELREHKVEEDGGLGLGFNLEKSSGSELQPENEVIEQSVCSGIVTEHLDETFVVRFDVEGIPEEREFYWDEVKPTRDQLPVGTRLLGRTELLKAVALSMEQLANPKRLERLRMEVEAELREKGIDPDVSGCRILTPENPPEEMDDSGNGASQHP